MKQPVLTVRPYRLAYLLAVAVAAAVMVGPWGVAIALAASLDLELA